jgi:hypothetical protein
MVDPYLKTTRAKKHLEDLRQELEVFYKSNPYRFVREDDVENQLHIVRMVHPDIPATISLVAGDIFYNLRAALDQLVWCLAKSRGTPSYPIGTQFPILEQRDPDRFARQTAGVSTQALAIIETLQPYNTPNSADIPNHLLWRLNKLCNIDKHMRIPLHGATGVITRPMPIAQAGFFFGDNLVMKIPLSMKSEMALDPKVTFHVKFGDFFWKVESDFAGIEAIYEFVANNVIPRFTRFFP